ncbi:MAG: hypothetical protein IKV15_05355 [Bacteroidaceae bacterium]|nr:hypothetical protein [Bacteroidaceae bacterium]
MEKEILRDRIERFFNAELTLDEERELYRYLCENEVPTELRKDKEAIIALCGGIDKEVKLPEGATQRLETMLDGLEEMQTRLIPHNEEESKGTNPRYILPPRKGWGSFLLRAACVAGVAVALFLALPDSKDEPTLAEVYEEEDTFATPEEAMQCFMAAYNDIMFAMNTARDNTREVHQALEQSVTTSLNLLKLEPTKNREL